MSVWLPLVTLVGGYGLKSLDDLRKEKRDDQRELQRRQLQLDDERRHREDDFQRDALLELQEALHALITITAKDIVERGDDMRQRGVSFPQSKSTVETGEKQQSLLGRVFVLQARVKDETTRDVTDELTAKFTAQSLLTLSPSEATLALHDVWQTFGKLNDHVGELLRERY